MRGQTGSMLALHFFGDVTIDAGDLLRLQRGDGSNRGCTGRSVRRRNALGALDDDRVFRNFALLQRQAKLGDGIVYGHGQRVLWNTPVRDKLRRITCQNRSC